MPIDVAAAERFVLGVAQIERFGEHHDGLDVLLLARRLVRNGDDQPSSWATV